MTACPACTGIMDNRCVDCTVDTWEIAEYYMVNDEIWDHHGAGTGMLCISCLEERMGRCLDGQDFTTAPINMHTDFRRSPLLQERLGVVGKVEGETKCAA